MIKGYHSEIMEMYENIRREEERALKKEKKKYTKIFQRLKT